MRRRGSGSWVDTCRSCLVGGAIGDALGADVEFLSIAAIRERFGPAGLTGYATGRGRITDDTQMTLFTAEGLIRAAHADRTADGAPTVPAVDAVWASYLRWLHTQDHHSGVAALGTTPGLLTGWLLTRRELWTPRAPGLTCVGALRSGRMGRPGDPINDSKGCGAVMRVAPVGLVAADPFRVAVEAAAVTHTHPTGYLAAGTFAAVVGALVDGSDLVGAIGAAVEELERWNGHEETAAAVRSALDLAARHPVPDPELVASLGGGWAGDEALAIALYCAVCAPDFRTGVLWAVNHSGDSDSTGSIAGNLLGLAGGDGPLPGQWVDALVEREVVERVAEDLALTFPVHDPEDPAPDPDLLDRYPPGP